MIMMDMNINDMHYIWVILKLLDNLRFTNLTNLKYAKNMSQYFFNVKWQDTMSQIKNEI